MLDILIIFVKLCHNWFLKNVSEISLCCTRNTLNEVYEPILSINRGDLEPLHLVKLFATLVHNFQPLTIVIKNSILDAAVPKSLIYFNFV